MLTSCSSRCLAAAQRAGRSATRHTAPCQRTQRWLCRRTTRPQRCRVAQPSTVYADFDFDEDGDAVNEPELGADEEDLELWGEDFDGADGGPDQGRELAVAMARVASDTKARDVMVLHVAPLVYWTSYLVLVTVTSRPQLQAILGKMERQARDDWGRVTPGVSPGRSVWEVLDFGDVVVHLFTAEQREYYDLESFYGAAEEVELPFAAETGEANWTRRF